MRKSHFKKKRVQKGPKMGIFWKKFQNIIFASWIFVLKSTFKILIISKEKRLLPFKVSRFYHDLKTSWPHISWPKGNHDLWLCMEGLLIYINISWSLQTNLWHDRPGLVELAWNDPFTVNPAAGSFSGRLLSFSFCTGCASSSSLCLGSLPSGLKVTIPRASASLSPSRVSGLWPPHNVDPTPSP